VSSKFTTLLRKTADLGRELVSVARAKQQLELSRSVQRADSNFQHEHKALQSQGGKSATQVLADGAVAPLACPENDTVDKNLQDVVVTQADREAAPVVHAPAVLTICRTGNGTIRAAGSAHFALHPEQLYDIVELFTQASDAWNSSTQSSYVKHGSVPLLVGNETVEGGLCAHLGVHVSPLARLRPLLAAAMIAVFKSACESWPTESKALMAEALKQHGVLF
jgi:hypothetical protein